MVKRAAIAVALLAGCAATPPRWDAMNDHARRAYMTDVVMPEMRKVFTDHDKARYARMTCATCHGADAEAKRWKMPNPDLLIEEHDVAAPHARMNAFMKDHVAPEMGRLLGRASFDCFGCHTLDR